MQLRVELLNQGNFQWPEVTRKPIAQEGQEKSRSLPNISHSDVED